MKKILIAGIGNIFFGDDAFGCEVVKLLTAQRLPANVKLLESGIKTRDLAFELCENPQLTILIDAVDFGKKAGTILLLELNFDDFPEKISTLSHQSRLEESLSFAKMLGAKAEKIYLLGCQPESLENLSETVKKSIVKAVKIVKNLINEENK